MSAARRVVVGLGSNLGDRRALLRRAAGELGRRAGELLALSPVYETEPVGPPQPRYLNAAALLSASLEPRALLEVLLAIELELGRARPSPVPLGPRTIDLDLLWIEGEAVRAPGLEVPHPRLEQRSFALRPLCDVASDARHPLTGARYLELEPSRAPLDRVADAP
jgi:2-amino-4-hydroxy-6-hydroxymethyldihydropteridine diphosphokinase